MRLVLIAVLFGSGVAPAQAILDPVRAKDLLALLDPVPGESQLRCEVTPVRPALNFSFRFQAGYMVRVPMSQYQGAGHAWGTLISVTPDAGKQPVYLGSRLTLPEIPKTKLEMEFGGAFLLGEGGYSVKWALADDSGRVCRKTWHVEARLSHGERSVKVAIPPGSVWSLSGRGSRHPRPAPDDAAPLRLTVLMHAAPMFPRRTRMRSNDTMLLLGSLSSLLEHVPARAVRLVVFNLDQQRELYRRENFTLDRLEQVSQSISSMELGLVDVEVLQNRRGHVDLIADMVNQEIRAKEPSDAVVFLGPLARYDDKIPRDSLEKTTAAGPQFYYFQVRPFFRGGRGGLAPPPANLPDSINSVISRLSGKVLVIHTPGEFAKAISKLEHRTGAPN